MDDYVRLTADIPELSLNRGEVGIVRGRQVSARGPGAAAAEVVYEVEFHQVGHDYQTRTLLWPHQLEVEEAALGGGPVPPTLRPNRVSDRHSA
jgi:hypothetical protein